MNKEILIVIFGVFQTILAVLAELTVSRTSSLYDLVKEDQQRVDAILEALLDESAN